MHLRRSGVGRNDADEPAVHMAERVEPRWLVNHDIRNWSGSEPHGYYEIVRRPWPTLD
jgi:hypothetical protein